MSKKLTTDEFVLWCSKKHNYKYSYEFVNYTASKESVIITCPIHGKFNQKAYKHISGRGCPECGKLNGGKALNSDIFISRSKKIHGGIYDYSETEYSVGEKVKIICKFHGLFYQSPQHHLFGHGCPYCKNDRLSSKYSNGQNEFLKRSKETHGNVYDYIKSIYKNRNEKVCIVCKLHGEFYQSPRKHWAGQGCPKCSSKQSKLEIEWLDSCGVPDDNSHRQVKISNYIVDGFLPEKNRVYEFNGDFWHGNPKFFKPTDINPKNKILFGDLHKNTIIKETTLKYMGYEVISMWESDWNILKLN